MKYLIVVDMQRDFIDGALANSAASVILPKMADYIKNFEGITIFTRDTHGSDYLETMEGKNLPIQHCICNSEGWQIHPQLIEACQGKEKNCCLFNKPTFGYAYELSKFINSFKQPITEIQVCGTVTSICVISQVLGLKEHFPEVKISLLSDMCADLTEQGQEAAINVMRACQVNII